MRMFKYLLAVFLAVSASGFPERITSKDQPHPIFSQYLKREIAPVLLSYARYQNEIIGCVADEGSSICLSEFDVLEPIIILKGGGHPLSGMWIQRFQLECDGLKRYYNLCFRAKSLSEGPLCLPLVMGRSIACPILQKDVMMQVMMAAYMQIPEDERASSDLEMHVIDSKVTQITEPSGCWFYKSAGSWSEEWTVLVAGQEFYVTIDFKSDGSGGTYFAVSAK